jgi:hypothetical protein
MVVSEAIAPKIMGEQRVAGFFADREDARMQKEGAKPRLLNEAPRGRAEKLAYEERWRYDLVPPQYMLARMPLFRIGTYARPEERPQLPGLVSLYAQKFWQAAIRNARDMKRLGIKVFKGSH